MLSQEFKETDQEIDVRTATKGYIEIPFEDCLALRIMISKKLENLIYTTMDGYKNNFKGMYMCKSWVPQRLTQDLYNGVD